MHYSKLDFGKSAFLVTGGAGFIGSNLCEALLSMNQTVRCLDNLSTGSMENIQPFMENPDFEFLLGDIRDLDTCLKACENVDFVLHQAAWGSVPRSIEMPLLYEEINIKGTLNMLEASRQQGIKKFIYASSSSVYGDEPNLPKIEGREGNLLSPYALTKRANEMYANLYSRIYQLETIGLRYFNVFGRRQNPVGQYAAVIPRFFRLLAQNQAPTIFGDGKQSRDFTYIENVIEANLKACLAKPEASGEAYNIAFGEQKYLIDVFYEISEILGCKIKPVFESPRKGDILHSLANIEKARKFLDYNPKYDFHTGIVESAKWYLSKENDEK